MYSNMPHATDTQDPILSANNNTGIVVYIYIAWCAVTDFSSNGVKQLKGNFSNYNDTYVLVAFGFFLYLCSTPTMFSKKFKMKMSYKSQINKSVPNMSINNDKNL